jgi:anti-anti-sigma factor
MTQATRQHLQVEVVAGVAVVHFVDREIVESFGECNDAREVGEQLYSLVDDGGYRKLLLNFRDVEFLSTSLLGRLIGLKRKVERVKGRLILCGLDHSRVQEAFRITGLDRVFEIHDDEPDALDRF